MIWSYTDSSTRTVASARCGSGVAVGRNRKLRPAGAAVGAGISSDSSDTPSRKLDHGDAPSPGAGVGSAVGSGLGAGSVTFRSKASVRYI